MATLTHLDWRNIALCASSRQEEAARAGDHRRASREGNTAMILYHGLYIAKRGLLDLCREL
jgi:hypothetical protein